MTENPTPQETTMTDATPEPALTPTPEISAEAGSRLSVLQERYRDAKAAADETSKQLKAITDAIKLELTQAVPEGTPQIDLTATDHAPGLRLSWTTSTRLDSKRLKSEQPETWARYAKSSGAWTLREVK